MAGVTEERSRVAPIPGMERASAVLERHVGPLCETASQVLTSLCGRQVQLTLNRIVPGSPATVSSFLAEPWVGMALHASHGLHGSQVFVWRETDAVAVAQYILGEEEGSASGVTSDQLDALSETANQIGGAYGTAMRAALGKPVTIETEARSFQNEADAWRAMLRNEHAAPLLGVADLTFQGSVRGEVAVIVSSLLLPEPEHPTPTGNASVIKENTVSAPSVSDRVAFAPLTGGGRAESANGIDMLLDVNLQVSVEIGRTRLQIRDILQLGPGSILELNKQAGEAVDILVNDKPIAKGEVIIIDESFGVRLTSISSVTDRIKNLR